MNNELVIKKCKSCGATVKIIEDCNCQGCAAVEKHVPNYEKVEDEIFVTVNHVMEKEHFIEWVALVADNKEYMVRLYPEQNAECRFPYIPGSILYAYCNKHGLWKKDVE